MGWVRAARPPRDPRETTNLAERPEHAAVEREPGLPRGVRLDLELLAERRSATARSTCATASADADPGLVRPAGQLAVRGMQGRPALQLPPLEPDAPAHHDVGLAHRDGRQHA